ncbi:hypothetical protein SNE40_012439 [Patella caerulea]|uniref:EF-hand domain-containing protein n=1 Tax=Patella caerulea TaxID=87958 RepID=A0AAN8PVX4_PATCE
MLTCVTLLFVVLLCGTEAAPTDHPQWRDIDYLVHLREMFYREDIDDDGKLEYTDARQTDLRSDADGDGVVTREEYDADPDLTGYDLDKDLDVIDVNNDGILTHEDTKLAFLLISSDFGNEWSLGEFIQFMTSKTEPPAKDNMTITIKSFARAERNFVVMDIDDDDLVSEDEFTSEYRVADYNRDGVLKDLELRGFRPIRNVPITRYCSDTTVGCKVEDFLKMFKEADINNDAQLDLKEYVVTFGELMDTE